MPYDIPRPYGYRIQPFKLHGIGRCPLRLEQTAEQSLIDHVRFLPTIR